MTPKVAKGARNRASSLIKTKSQWGSMVRPIPTPADQCVEMGLAWKKTAAEELMPEVNKLAKHIAAMPIVSLVHTKNLVLAPRLAEIEAARKREIAAFAELVGAPANREAIQAFKEKRPADFTNLPEK